MSGTPKLLGERYEVGEVIGRGGMAEVHLGKDLRLGRSVAVKVLRADLARDPAFQARFRREAQSAASLNHPAIVAVYDTGEDVVDGLAVPFIVMEFVEGTTLRDLLSSGKRLVPARAMEVTASVLTALEYSHRQGIVHRDIKPGNVMLTSDGQVKVMDFGIARALADTGAMTQTAAVMGTAQYLSPEQARGEQVDARSDLYSTGCLLYELLTGRPPFTGDSPVSVAYQHVREEAQPPSAIDREVPPAADTVTMKSLTKDRDHRYQTAGEFRADLERAIAGQAVLAGASATTSAITAGRPTRDYAATAAIPAVGGGASHATARSTRPEEPEERSGGFWLTLVLAALAVFALFAIAGYFIFSDSDDVPPAGETPALVQVPSVVGETYDDARRTLSQAGFEVTQKTEANDAERGQVLEQDPESGEEVESGAEVTLTVSAGPGAVKMPPLVGLSRSAAESTLKDLKINFDVEDVDSSRAKNIVVGTDPVAGREIAADSEVTLQVASGRNTLPNLVGQTEAAAIQELSRRGFTPAVERSQGPEGSAGRVWDQQPEGDSTQDVGTRIVLKVGIEDEEEPSVSATPETTSPTPSVSITPSTSESALP